MKRSETSTRRDFLRRSAYLAAVAAIPVFLDEPDCRACRRRPRLEKPTHGRHRRRRARHRDRPTRPANLANMVACANARRRQRRALCRALQSVKCQVYTDYRKVLDRKDVQAITLAMPDHWHTKIAIEAMRAGKDVVLREAADADHRRGQADLQRGPRDGAGVPGGNPAAERVFARASSCEAVAFARSGRLWQEAESHRLAWKSEAGRALYDRQAAGRLELGLSGWARPPRPPIPKPHRYHVPLLVRVFRRRGYRLGRPSHRHRHVGWGGENTGPIEVEGKGEFPLGRELMLETLLGKKPFDALPPSYNVATTYNCTMTLPGGNSIVLSTATYDLLIEGERGAFGCPSSPTSGLPLEASSRSSRRTPNRSNGSTEQVPKLYRGKPIRGHMANFLDCVKDRSLPIPDVFTHVNSVNACHMANIAMLLGRKVRWDLKRAAVRRRRRSQRPDEPPQRRPIRACCRVGAHRSPWVSGKAKSSWSPAVPAAWAG